MSGHSTKMSCNDTSRLEQIENTLTEHSGLLREHSKILAHHSQLHAESRHTFQLLDDALDKLRVALNEDIPSVPTVKPSFFKALWAA